MHMNIFIILYHIHLSQENLELSRFVSNQNISSIIFFSSQFHLRNFQLHLSRHAYRNTQKRKIDFSFTRPTFFVVGIMLRDGVSQMQI